MYVVILAGGSGTRFWPLSRTKTPKQLMSVFGGKSMLQRTVERVLPLAPKRILVVTNVAQAAGTALQLAEYKQLPIDVIQEPVVFGPPFSVICKGKPAPKGPVIVTPDAAIFTVAVRT